MTSVCARWRASGTLVAAGGIDVRNAYLGAVEALDPRTNAWRRLAPLRTPRQLIGLASEGDVIFAVGGFDGRETSRAVEVYDARADRWMDAAPGAAAAGAGGVLRVDM